MTASLSAVTQFYLLSWLAQTGIVQSIGCYKCISENGSNPLCEDSFNYLPHLDDEMNAVYEDPCWSPRKDRNGIQPATACIKMTGTYSDGVQVTVRNCGVDSGSLTSDTEIVRMSHCGSFIYNDRYVRGCIQNCDDQDGCNSASKLSNHQNVFVFPCFVFGLMVIIRSLCLN